MCHVCNLKSDEKYTTGDIRLMGDLDESQIFEREMKWMFDVCIEFSIVSVFKAKRNLSNSIRFNLKFQSRRKKMKWKFTNAIIREYTQNWEVSLPPLSSDKEMPINSMENLKKFLRAMRRLPESLSASPSLLWQRIFVKRKNCFHIKLIASAFNPSHTWSTSYIYI